MHNAEVIICHTKVVKFIRVDFLEVVLHVVWDVLFEDSDVAVSVCSCLLVIEPYHMAKFMYYSSLLQNKLINK